MKDYPKSDNIEVRNSGIQGKGVFAGRRIRRGARIIEYTGRRLTNEEVEQCSDSSNGRHHTFLFEVDAWTTIDGAIDGNDARFINHSCDPNCEAVCEDGRIFIYALKNIQPGVELTFDYSYEVDEPITDELLRYYQCRCQAVNCRNTILNLAKYQKTPSKIKKSA
ncbi:MAG: SET domain-containing protein [Candidatus Zixiibacteriota bacterium]